MKLKLNLSHGLKLVAELHRVFTARGTCAYLSLLAYGSYGFSADYQGEVRLENSKTCYQLDVSRGEARWRPLAS